MALATLKFTGVDWTGAGFELRDSASASQVLEIKMCATMISYFNNYVRSFVEVL